ncbi:hypothetical protein GGF31_003461 [Allomyces arbusculus]|nr:hypothetical protein GGF31_003461 [Allomyces arbusculus]
MSDVAAPTAPTSSECPICREIMTVPFSKLAECGHRYCTQCISAWIVNGNNRTCPYCRTPTTPASIISAHRIPMDYDPTKKIMIAGRDYEEEIRYFQGLNDTAFTFNIFGAVAHRLPVPITVGVPLPEDLVAPIIAPALSAPAVAVPQDQDQRPDTMMEAVTRFFEANPDVEIKPIAMFNKFKEIGWVEVIEEGHALAPLRYMTHASGSADCRNIVYSLLKTGRIARVKRGMYKLA